MPSFLSPLIRDPTGSCGIRNTRTGELVARQATGAFDSQSRRTGLLKHTSLPTGEALVIAPTNGIHTFFMKFPIDVVFVERTGRVLQLRRNLGPWRIALCLRAHAAIELAAGVLSGIDTRPGDQLEVVSAETS